MMDGWMGLLLAQADADRTDFFRRWAESMRKFPRHTGIVLVSLIVLLVGVFFVLRRVASRSPARGRARDDPMGVFHGLVSRHRLPQGAARVLEEVAAAFSLVDPGVLFVRPSVFDLYLGEHLRGIKDADLRRRAQEEVDDLRKTIFGAIDGVAGSTKVSGTLRQGS